MELALLSLAIVIGICVAIWNSTGSRFTSNEDLVFRAKIYAFLGLSLLLITIVYSALEGFTFKQVILASLPGHKSNFTVYLFYFLASNSASCWVIYMLKRSIFKN
jgi:hypothetical protein